MIGKAQFNEREWIKNQCENYIGAHKYIIFILDIYYESTSLSEWTDYVHRELGMQPLTNSVPAINWIYQMTKKFNWITAEYTFSFKI